jgi:Mg-chelatase subunit ChlI
VEITGIRDARDRVTIIENNLAFESDPEAFRKLWQPHEDKLSRLIAHARTMVEKVTYTRRDLLSIAALTASLNVDGHRADLVILKAARAHAAYEERSAITDRDIALAAELALPHRIKHGPFQQSEISPEQLQERIEQLQGSSSDGEPSEEPQKEPDATDVKKKS